MLQHRQNKGKKDSFAGRYFCYNLIYYERYRNINQAIEREKEIKMMSRSEKLGLIKEFNPMMHFLKVNE